MGLGSMTAKDASLTMTLSADSGYSAVSEYRVSAYEWGDIVALCEGSERGKALAAGPELLGHLRFAVTLLSALPGFSGTAQVDAMRAAIAKVEGQS